MDNPCYLHDAFVTYGTLLAEQNQYKYCIIHCFPKKLKSRQNVIGQTGSNIHLFLSVQGCVSRMVHEHKCARKHISWKETFS